MTLTSCTVACCSLLFSHQDAWEMRNTDPIQFTSIDTSRNRHNSVGSLLVSSNDTQPELEGYEIMWNIEQNGKWWCIRLSFVISIKKSVCINTENNVRTTFSTCRLPCDYQRLQRNTEMFPTVRTHLDYSHFSLADITRPTKKTSCSSGLSAYCEQSSGVPRITL